MFVRRKGDFLDITHYNIFRKSFPNMEMTFEQLKASLENAEMISEGEKGFAAVSGNCIRLICVSPEYRGQGIGQKLLSDCERVISEKGFSEAGLGGFDSPLFIGATEDSVGFFEKMGYTFNDGCAEMTLDFPDFDICKLEIPIYPEGVSFGFYSGDREPLYAAVRSVDEEWEQYFENDEPVFCAFEKGVPVGFTIVDYDALCILGGEGQKVGSIGCVGTVPAARRRGIGLAMAAHACTELKKSGCTRLFVHYTHLEKWYAKIGCLTFMRYHFGRKII